MKVAIVTTWFERGAAYVSRQYRDLLLPHHDVVIYARGGEVSARKNPRWNGSDVTWARNTATHGNTAFHLGHFRRWLRSERPDLVLFNEQQWWAPVLLCRDLGIRTVAYVDYYTEETVPLFANYDLLLCHTDRHRAVFDWHPHCVYLPWGTPTDRFRMQASDPVEPGLVTFFHSAGHNPARKGTDLLLRAFEEVVSPAKLLVHSQRELASALPEAEEQIRALEAAGRLVVHTGDVAEPGLYHLGDVYVYPTRLEGIGLTVPEAIACGLPAVVPDCAPMSEFVTPDSGRRVAVERYQPRRDGYYWPQCIVDVADLTRQMEWYASRAKELPELKRRARSHAEARLDWERNCGELPGILERVARLEGPQQERAREEALQFERGRADLRLFYPLTSRVLLRSADFLRPLASRYSGRGRAR